MAFLWIHHEFTQQAVLGEFPYRRLRGGATRPTWGHGSSAWTTRWRSSSPSDGLMRKSGSRPSRRFGILRDLYRSERHNRSFRASGVRSTFRDLPRLGEVGLQFAIYKTG